MRAKRRIASGADDYRRQAAGIEAVSGRTLETISEAHFVRWEAAGRQLEPLPGRISMLVGRPRSGTTLLEQVLDSHPELNSADELATFSEVVYFSISRESTSGKSDPELLDELSQERLVEVRSEYWRATEGALQEAVGCRMLLDKNPALTGLLPVVGRVFPASKVVFALRDPRDVVLSCFLQQLPLNPLSVNYLTLAGTAQSYASTMNLWLKIRPLLRNPWIEVRYEDVVADLSKHARRVLNFLELPWDDSVLNYQHHAKTKHVHSPTYEAVAQPLYTTSIGRWRRYAEQLAPCLEILRPFVDAFEYDD